MPLCGTVCKMTFSHSYRTLTCDTQTDRQTQCHGIYHTNMVKCCTQLTTFWSMSVIVNETSVYSDAEEHCTYLYKAKRKKELSECISSTVPFLSPVGNHSRKCTSIQITIVGCVSFTYTIRLSAEALQTPQHQWRNDSIQQHFFSHSVEESN